MIIDKRSLTNRQPGGRKPDGQAKSVAFGEEKPDLLRPQSSSSASSGCTKVVERVETLNTEARIAPIKRRQTQVPVVKLSWWDCVKAVFKPGGLKTLKQKLAATVQLAELDDADERVSNPLLDEDSMLNL